MSSLPLQDTAASAMSAAVASTTAATDSTMTMMTATASTAMSGAGVATMTALSFADAASSTAAITTTTNTATTNTATTNTTDAATAAITTAATTATGVTATTINDDSANPAIMNAAVTNAAIMNAAATNAAIINAATTNAAIMNATASILNAAATTANATTIVNAAAGAPTTPPPRFSAATAVASLLSPRSALAGQTGSVRFTLETAATTSLPPEFSSPPKPKSLKDLNASEFRNLTPSYYLSVYKGHLRTPAKIQSDVLQKLNKQGLQHDILGETCLRVFESHEEFKAAQDKLHGNIKTNGGAVALNWGKTRFRPNTTKGPCMSVLCDAAGTARGEKTKKTDCKWGFEYELSTEGWMAAGPTKDAIKAYKKMQDENGNLATIHDIHNHLLPKTKAESHAKPSLRSIPEELLPMADDLNKTAFSNAAIYDFLLRQCDLKELEVNFTKRDVDNRYRHSATAAVLDCSDLSKFPTSTHCDVNFAYIPSLTQWCNNASF
jgi:hypothetical protein